MPEKLDMELGFDYEKRHDVQRLERETELYEQTQPYETATGHFAPNGDPINVDQWHDQDVALAMDAQLEQEAEEYDRVERLKPTQIVNELAKLEVEDSSEPEARMLRSHLKAVLAKRVYETVQREHVRADGHNRYLEDMDKEKSDEDRRAARMKSLMDLKDKQVERLKGPDAANKKPDEEGGLSDTQKIEIDDDSEDEKESRFKKIGASWKAKIKEVRENHRAEAKAARETEKNKTPEEKRREERIEKAKELKKQQQSNGEQPKLFVDKHTSVQFQQSEVGDVRNATFLTRKTAEGSAVPLKTLGEKRMIITNEDGEEFYFYDGKRGQIFNMTATEKDSALTAVESLGEMDDKDVDDISIVLGKKLTIGATELGVIESVLIDEGSASAAQPRTYRQVEAKDPFDNNEDVIAEVVRGAMPSQEKKSVSGDSTGDPVAPTDKQSIRQRMRQALARAVEEDAKDTRDKPRNRRATAARPTGALMVGNTYVEVAPDGGKPKEEIEAEASAAK